MFGKVRPQVPASILQFHPKVIVIGDEEALSVIRRDHPDFL
jgi:glucosamine-6-phosphate deaminase